MRNIITRNNGREYYACRHELEYSSDPSDKLVLSTRFADDGNFYYGNHNYTMLVTVSHPTSTIDTTFASHVAITDMSLSTGTNIEYMTYERELKNAYMRAEIHKIRNTLKMELDTAMKKAEVTAEATEQSGIYKYSIVAKDETKQVDANLEIDTVGSSFEAEAHLNPRNPYEAVSLKGSYVSPTSVQLLASHGIPGSEVTDTEVLIEKRDDNVMRTKLNWRPDILSDLKDVAVDAFTSIDTTPLRKAWRQAKRFSISELRGKIQAIKASLPDPRPLATFLHDEATSFATDYKVMQRELNRMYWRNEFFMKDIDKVFDATIGVISKAARTVVTYALNVASDMIDLCIEICQKVKAFVTENFGEYIRMAKDLYARYKPVVIAKLKEMLGFLKDKSLVVYSWMKENLGEYLMSALDIALDTLGKLFSWVEPYVEYCVEFILEVHDTIVDIVTMIKETYEAIKNSYPVQKVSGWYSKAKSAAVRLGRAASQVNYLGPIYDAHISLMDKVQTVTNKMGEHADRLSQQYSSAIYSVHEAINSRVEDYLEMPTSEYLKKIMREAVDQATWAYNYLGLEQKIKEFVEDVCASAIKFVKKNSIYMLDEYLQLDLDRIITYDPRSGDIEFQFVLPTEWPTLQTVPFTTVKWSDLWEKLQDIYDNMNMVPDEFNLWDYYYQYKPASLNPVDWVPPYKAYATINGQHYSTFDGKNFEFMGTCDYILAHDVVSNQFTVVGNYPEKTLTIFVDEKKIDMTMDGVVTIDGTPTELPVELKSTDITRIGDVIKVETQRGLTVTMDTKTQLIALELSGWFYNKVAGLLGTYTNEVYDDFLTGTAERTDDLLTFTGSWKVGDDCRYNANTAHVAQYDESRASGRICKVLFDSSISPMRNCLKVINPLPYLKACVNDVEATSDTEGGVCRAAVAYAFRCKKAGIPVQVPRACRHCRDQTQNTNPQSADVVFVIEQKQCNSEITPKLSILASMLDRSLQGKGLTGNQFGLVGYGGRGVHNEPHTHTVGSKLMGSARDMKTAADSLVFIEDGYNTDTMGAMKMAAEYPFRAGVTNPGPLAEFVKSFSTQASAQ